MKEYICKKYDRQEFPNNIDQDLKSQIKEKLKR